MAKQTLSTLLLLGTCAPITTVFAQTTTAPQNTTSQKPTLEELARSVEQLRAELDALRADRNAAEASRRELEARYASLLEEFEARTKSGASPTVLDDAWYHRLTLGGYGEIKLNAVEGEGHDQIDNARFVAYFGYRFSDSIHMDSEIEFEHSLVEDGHEGELALEQLHFDFLFNEQVNVRAGRFLTPLGIVNQTHEPTTFNGVERPAFETFIIPTTWSSDGAGIFGRLSERLKYELYLASSLDGTGFDAVEGIREGRQQETPGISEPAISGRLDYYALQNEKQNLRLGLSFFGGGLDNGNQGVNPDLDADLEVYSADLQYSVARWDFRGVYAFEKINGAAEIGNNVASEIDGYYVEAAFHFLPEHSRQAERDAVAFVRYDNLDTQKEMPEGVTADEAGKRDEITVGLGYYPVRNLVIKADYQIRDDDTDQGVADQFNLGLGWVF